MGVVDKIRGFSEKPAATTTNLSGEVYPKQEAPTDAPVESDSDDSRMSLEARDDRENRAHPDQVTQDAQLGQQKAEAMALVWSKKALVATYAWIWLCFFLLALQSGISSSVINNVYANFKSAPQVSTANILYTIIGGVLRLPIAKILNLWGRAEGFLVFLGVYTLGLIITAACDNPDSYAAGYTIFWVGYEALYYILDVFIADTSGLRNRAFTFAFAQTPFICTAFTAPLAGQAFVNGPGWRWAYGAFCIIQPVMFAPLALVFKHYERKAEKAGLLRRERSSRTVLQSIVHYIHMFDIIGAAILMAAWILVLLPFSLQSYGQAQYKSASFIAMLVIGFCLFFVFAAWEKWVAREHFIRYELVKNRTILGACIMAALSWFSFYCWDQYFMVFCQVVYGLELDMAGYMLQIYNVGSCFWGVMFGLWIRYTHHFKNTCLFFGLPLMILGSGLLIHFRGTAQGIGYVVMCQIFIAFGGGTIVIGNQMAVMAAADRDGVPMMLAVLQLFNNLGGAVGLAVAAAIYNNTWADALLSKIPAKEKPNWSKIFMGGYLEQWKYPLGSATRDAINYAWGQSQMYGAIASTAFLALGIPAIAIWKNYNVDRKQNKGTVL
ncbi:putative siderochrome-iron transporter [Aspergillus candidus]|uniref:MFS general substrate transporter n=1 Tax=Aspergillus candidus TaxID=41067 RepID=A0A2I2F7K0_ASPCN|nr:MFS general substrate transporter [Aspergillus candidus]PLB36607.1 MFS general substrate transporter [Aspergillus candidus]